MCIEHSKYINLLGRGDGIWVVVHAFNPADRGTQISEFEASLVFRVSSRTVRDTQRNSDSKAFNPSTQAYLYECYMPVRSYLKQIKKSHFLV